MSIEAPSEIVETQEDENNSHPLEPSLRDIQLSIKTLPRYPLLAFIRLYQLTISRALPANTCRFYPSCSHYGYQAVYKYGAIKGGIMAIWRVLRCNPFNPGGYDPVE
jgi:putative membrane protein insertion efficiency factor